MKNLIAIIILFVSIQNLYGQKVKTPSTINKAIEILTIDCPDSLQQIIKKTSNDSLIELCYPWNGEYKTVFHWTEKDNKRSKIKKHLIENGIESNQHQQTVVLIAFKHFLNGKDINEQEIYKPYKKIEDKWRSEDKVRFITDSLRGEYIPKDIEDCFKQIDSFWDDSTKIQVKQWTEDQFSAKAHFGFGMWMRNNWQLWGGSRLSKYFNEMGIYHPDDMSGIILDSYHRYLTGKDILLENQIEYYQLYWKVGKEPSKDIYPKGVRRLEFDRSQSYKTKEGNKPGRVHIQTNSKSDKTWIYDYYLGWKQISDEELDELSLTNYENRESTLEKIFNKE